MCSYESGWSWVELSPCPQVTETARTLRMGGRVAEHVSGYQKPLKVHEEQIDHDALCAQLNRPQSDVGPGDDEKKSMKLTANCPDMRPRRGPVHFVTSWTGRDGA